MFSHTNASLQGLSTIRAFGAQAVLENEFHDYQNQNTSMWFVFLSITRAFAFWLDIACVLYIAVVTYTFLFMESGK
jgi:ATP-binding cassette, subfamily C (CFTR/MRP), member 4